MKKWFPLFAALVLFPTFSFGYVGVNFGAVDKDNLGYGLSFGGTLPLNFGIDVQLVGFHKTGTPSTSWLQGNADLFYDVGGLLSLGPLHPYIKGGFTYAGLYAGTDAGYGPGFNIGGGLDFKIFPALTIGVDMTESIISFGDITSNGVTLVQGSTDKVFNILAVVKFFAY